MKPDAALLQIVVVVPLGNQGTPRTLGLEGGPHRLDEGLRVWHVTVGDDRSFARLVVGGMPLGCEAQIVASPLIHDAASHESLLILLQGRLFCEEGLVRPRSQQNLDALLYHKDRRTFAFVAHIHELRLRTLCRKRILKGLQLSDRMPRPRGPRSPNHLHTRMILPRISHRNRKHHRRRHCKGTKRNGIRNE